MKLNLKSIGRQKVLMIAVVCFAFAFSATAAFAALTFTGTAVTGSTTLDLTGAVGSAITIGDAAQTGDISVGTSTGAMSLNLGTGNSAKTISLGTGTGIKTIHIGDNATPVNAITIGGTNSGTTIGGTLAASRTLTSQTTENNDVTVALSTDSTYLAGSDITYSGGSGSSALKLTGTYSGVNGGYSNIYSLVTNTGAQTAATGGVVGIKGVTLNTAAQVDGNMYGAQFIAKHNHATNKAANEAAFIGVEGVVTQGTAGQIGTAIGGSFAIHIPDDAAVFDSGAVHRGVQITMDGGTSGNAPSESTGLAIWNMAGTHDSAIKVIGTFTKDLTLQNGETIDNNSNNVVKITSAGIIQAFDAAAYWTATVTDAGGVNFNDTSDGTAGFSFSDPVQFGGSSTAGILHGAGATDQSGAISLGATGGKAMSYYIKSSSATASHTLEGMYITTYYGNDATSVAPKGEAGRFRAYLVGDAASGTIAGAHDTTEIGAGGTNTGLTIGTRGNVIFPNEVIGASGTFAGMQAELNTGGAATDVSGTTTSILRLIIDGTAPTLPAQFTVPVMSVVLPTNLVGDNLVVDDAASANTVGGKMRITVNGTTYWIMLADASD